HRAVRGILGEHRRGDRAAALQRGQCFARDQRLAAQDAVLVGKRQPDDFELLLLDDAAKPARGFLLLVRPQAVTLDKTQRATPVFSPSPRSSRGEGWGEGLFPQRLIS